MNCDFRALGHCGTLQLWGRMYVAFEDLFVVVHLRAGHATNFLLMVFWAKLSMVGLTPFMPGMCLAMGASSVPSGGGAARGSLCLSSAPPPVGPSPIRRRQWGFM